MVAGGGWANLSVAGAPPPPPPSKTAPAFNPLYIYDTVDDRWSRGPDPPYVQGRGQGGCSGSAMYLVSGYQKHVQDRADPAVPATVQVAKLEKRLGAWVWTMLPPLPKGQGRWLGAAGVAGGYLVVATGSNSTGFSAGATAYAGPPQPAIPPALPGFRLKLGGNGGAGWEPIAPFPGGGLDCTDYAVAGGELYVFGGWRARAESEAAWSALFGLGLPVPILEGTIGAQLSRKAYKYSPGSDHWVELADVPEHVENGGATVVQDRYVLLLGSTHGKNSFRVGVDRGPGPPDMSLARDSGIVTYYGDSVLCYDTATGKYSRVGVMPYGVITAHWGSNGTHVIGVAGEPRHGWNSNSESLVQIGELSFRDAYT